MAPIHKKIFWNILDLGFSSSSEVPQQLLTVAQQEELFLKYTCQNPNSRATIAIPINKDLYSAKKLN